MENKVKIPIDATFRLSEIIGNGVFLKEKKIGKLSEIVIIDRERLPEITHFIVSRRFGYPSLLIPIEKVGELTKKRVVINIDNIEDYEKQPEPSQILLKDHILDKKVLDLDDSEVEVVYDVKLVMSKQKMFVSEVDFSKYGLLRRIGLKGLANFIYNLADLIKEETLSWDYVQPLPEQLTSFKGNVKLKVLNDKLPDIHPVDLADILEELDHDQRMAVFNELDMEHASDTLEEVEPRVQRDLISSIDVKRAAALINDMTPAQSADILSILPASDADMLLSYMDQEAVQKIQYLMDKHDEKISHFSTNHYIKASLDWTAEYVLQNYQKIAAEKDIYQYLYIVDLSGHLLGVVDIREVLLAKPSEKLGAVMIDNIISLLPETTLQQAANMFTRYGFRAIPLIDEENVILGVVPYRDVMHLKHRFV